MVSVPSFVSSNSLKFRDPVRVFERLQSCLGRKNVYLLESLAGPEKDRKASYIGVFPEMSLELSASRVTFSGNKALVDKVIKVLEEKLFHCVNNCCELDSAHQFWDLLRAVQSAFVVENGSKGSDFSFGFFGYFGYEVCRAVENLPPAKFRLDQPDAVLTLYTDVLIFDHEEKQLLHRKTTLPECKSHDLSSLIKEEDLPEILSEIAPVKPFKWEDSVTRSDYLKMVDKALGHVQIGDIYQVQIGHEVTVKTETDPFDVYKRLRWRNPGPYMYFAEIGPGCLIGSSPEVYVRVQNNKLVMRPIAGTAPRTGTVEKDLLVTEELLKDKKELAEHVMLVDLCRNDMARVCTPGSVETNELMTIEEYSHLFHIVSNVEGELSPDMDVYDAIAYGFPAGTMSGAPKVRAMEIINDLETSPRGIYSGAVGLIDFEGFAVTALCIRTGYHSGDKYCLRASAGIVADSVPEKEWLETQAKLGAVYWAITDEELKL